MEKRCPLTLIQRIYLCSWNCENFLCCQLGNTIFHFGKFRSKMNSSKCNTISFELSLNDTEYLANYDIVLKKM